MGFVAGEVAETAVAADGGQSPRKSLPDHHRVAAGNGTRIGALGAVRERARRRRAGRVRTRRWRIGDAPG